MLAAVRHGLCDETFEIKPEIEFALASIQHTGEFAGKAARRAMPALTTHTKLFDLVKDETLDSRAHFLVMGMPHPEAQGVSARIRDQFPFSYGITTPSDPSFDDMCCSPAESNTDECLTHREIRFLTGNAMHWGALAAHTMHMLSSTKFEF